MENERKENSASLSPARRGRFFLFLAIALLGTAADLVSKHIVFSRLGFPSGRVSWVVENIAGFQTSLNQGALWGLGSGQIKFFVAASVLALIGVGFWFRQEGRRSLTVTISLGLITAGILGNLWDRLALHGMRWPEGIDPLMAGKPIHAVRDWILVLIGSYHWPNFNIADSCLVAGTILMIAYVLLFKGDAPKNEEEEKEAKTEGDG